MTTKQQARLEALENWRKWRAILDRIVANPNYSAKNGVWGTPKWRLAINLSKFAATQLGIYNDKVFAQ